MNERLLYASSFEFGDSASRTLPQHQKPPMWLQHEQQPPMRCAQCDTARARVDVLEQELSSAHARIASLERQLVAAQQPAAQSTTPHATPRRRPRASLGLVVEPAASASAGGAAAPSPLARTARTRPAASPESSAAMSPARGFSAPLPARDFSPPPPRSPPPPSTPPPCTPPPPTSQAPLLTGLTPEHSAAGWREYSDPRSGHTLYVNDCTYEEAGSLEKVEEKWRAAEARARAGIRATGRRFDAGGEELVQCPTCSRKFGANSIARHREICARNAESHASRWNT